MAAVAAVVVLRLGAHRCWPTRLAPVSARSPPRLDWTLLHGTRGRGGGAMEAAAGADARRAGAASGRSALKRKIFIIEAEKDKDKRAYGFRKDDYALKKVLYVSGPKGSPPPPAPPPD